MHNLLLALLLLGSPADWKQDDEVDGILIETRAVEGSSFDELRLTAVSDASIDSLCDAAYGDGKIDASQPEVKARKILEEKPDERVFYDQIGASFVSDRDYALRIRRIHQANGSCELPFTVVNSRAPPLQDGWVRIEQLRGSWKFEPDFDGKTRITYVIFTDPGGSVPAFLASGALRRSAIRCMKMVLGKGRPARLHSGASASAAHPIK